jgi:hypothetical protein
MHAEFQENFGMVPIQGHALLPRHGLFFHRVNLLAQRPCTFDRYFQLDLPTCLL